MAIGRHVAVVPPLALSAASPAPRHGPWFPHKSSHRLRIRSPTDAAVLTRHEETGSDANPRRRARW